MCLGLQHERVACTLFAVFLIPVYTIDFWLLLACTKLPVDNLWPLKKDEKYSLSQNPLCNLVTIFASLTKKQLTLVNRIQHICVMGKHLQFPISVFMNHNSPEHWFRELQ